MLHPQDIDHVQDTALAVQPRARGRVVVRAKGFAGRSVLDDLHQAGSLKVVFPRLADHSLQAVTVNTAGGITGGDKFDATFEAPTDTQLVVTTQAAERAYRAASDEAGQVSTQLRVGAGGALSWLPQETILFEGARFSRRMAIDLEAGARLLFVEPLVFGRTAQGEALRDVTFRDRVDVRRAGAPLFADAMTLTGDVTARLGLSALGSGAFASVLYVAPDAAAHLDAARALLPRTGGASLLAEDVLHIRLLAPDSYILRQSLVPVLERLSAAPLPRVWRI